MMKWPVNEFALVMKWPVNEFALVMKWPVNEFALVMKWLGNQFALVMTEKNLKDSSFRVNDFKVNVNHGGISGCL